MLFSLNKQHHGLDERMRSLGYRPYRNRHGRMSYIRTPHGGDLPRFHLYIEHESERTLHCSLHYDRTGPRYLKDPSSYEASFDAPEVAEEASRLQHGN